jgi:hypothetical protein
VGLLAAGRADLHTDCHREDVWAALVQEPHKFWLLTHLVPERTFIQRLSNALSGLLVKRSSANLADPLLYFHTPPPFAVSVRGSYSIAQHLEHSTLLRVKHIVLCVLLPVLQKLHCSARCAVEFALIGEFGT